MRALLHVDVVTAGRALLSLPTEDRIAACDALFDQAHAADKYRKRFGLCHPKFGTGSLASACWSLKLQSEPFLSDRAYAKCLTIIFERVLRGPFNPMRK
jgi:hypothetical protein